MTMHKIFPFRSVNEYHADLLILHMSICFSYQPKTLDCRLLTCGACASLPPFHPSPVPFFETLLSTPLMCSFSWPSQVNLFQLPAEDSDCRLLNLRRLSVVNTCLCSNLSGQPASDSILATVRKLPALEKVIRQ